MPDHEDDSAPLLGGPQSTAKPGRDGQASMTSCVANLSNTILGTGMLAMPHAFASGGLIPGIVTVFWCGATAALGLYFLARSAAKAPHRAASFAALSKLTFPRLSRAFDIAIFLKCYGVSISYLIIIGALMPRAVASFVPDAPAWLLDRRLWILVSMMILCPLAFLRKLDHLKFTSYVALCSVVDLIFVVVYKYFDPSGLPARGPVRLVALGPSFVSSLPVQIFAYTCAQNLFSIYNELKDNSQKRLNTVIGTSIGSATGIYQVLGILGYLTFGTNVGSNIIEMYPHSLLVSTCQLGLVVLVLFSYPLQVHPSRASLDKAIFPPTDDEDGIDDGILVGDHDSAEIPLLRFVVETSFILLTTFLISMFVDDLSVVLGFVGATGSVSISFILPSVYFISLFKDSPSRKDQRLRLAALALLVWGIAVMIVSLSLQFWHLISTDDETKLGSSLTVLGHLGGKPIPGIANPDISTPIR